MITGDINQIARFANIVSGTLHPERLTVFAPMRNEMHFLPAWLEHHRSIGFEQFLVWDDASSDGSFEFLCDQSDCVVMTAEFRYSHPVKYTDPFGKTMVERLGTVLKASVPHTHFAGRYCAYLDADEFLILPPDVSSVRTIVEELERKNEHAVYASSIEFFPETLSAFDREMPRDLSGLLATYPYIQAEPLIDPASDADKPVQLNSGKSADLFAQYGIKLRAEKKLASRILAKIKGKDPFQKIASTPYKVPLIKRSSESFQVGSHRSSIRPSQTHMLAIAHFVFTALSFDKAQRAVAEKTHSDGSSRYRAYLNLFDAMEERGGSFLDEKSVVYKGPQQLIDLELMRW